MKAITLWPEWAHAIVDFGEHSKRIENRDWPATWMIGKRFAIHAGAYIGGRKGMPATLEGLESVTVTARALGLDVQYGHAPPRFRFEGMRPVVTGAVVCTAVLAKCERNKNYEAKEWRTLYDIPPWANPESKYWWHLADVEVLAVPVPCGGHQGFWEWAA